MPTSYILLVRLTAGVLNVAPPLVGSYALGREVYGEAASILAIAAMVFGLVSQYLSQNLLRMLCTAQRAERAVASAMLFCAACIGAAVAVHVAGIISGREAAQLATLVVATTMLRICEVHLISAGRIVASIVVFYAAPPLLCSLFFLVAARLGGGPAAAAAAQCAGYSLAAMVAVVTARDARGVLARAFRTPAVSVAKELARSMPLVASGAATSAAEFLPIVLLRGMDAFSVIPVYEIARKIASVPTTLANPLLNQVNPAMIRAYASRNKPEMHRLLRQLFRLLSFGAVLFLLAVAALLIGGLYRASVHDVSELLLPLSVGTVVAMWCVPYQSLLIAAHGDHWFTVSSGLSVVLLLGLTYAFSGLGPALAVSCAVGLSASASALVMRNRAIKAAYPSGPGPASHDARSTP